MSYHVENEITKENDRETICCMLKYLLNYGELEIKSKDDSNNERIGFYSKKCVGGSRLSKVSECSLSDQR